jgi:hypothetical protein
MEAVRDLEYAVEEDEPDLDHAGVEACCKVEASLLDAVGEDVNKDTGRDDILSKDTEEEEVVVLVEPNAVKVDTVHYMGQQKPEAHTGVH